MWETLIGGLSRDGCANQECVLTGSWTGNLLLCGSTPNQLGHTSQGTIFFFLRQSRWTYAKRISGSLGIAELCLVGLTIPFSYLHTYLDPCEGSSACLLNYILSFVCLWVRRLRPSKVKQLAQSCITGARIKTITETILFSLWVSFFVTYLPGICLEKCLILTKPAESHCGKGKGQISVLPLLDFFWVFNYWPLPFKVFSSFVFWKTTVSGFPPPFLAHLSPFVH